MKQNTPWFRNNLLLGVLTVLGVILGKVLLPINYDAPNQIAEMNVEQIGAAWFVPGDKTDEQVVWLEQDDIEPLYRLLSSQSVENSPAKWIYIGKVGFTCRDGRVAAVELYDTQTDVGAFRCGGTYFRYKGRLPKCISEVL